MRVITPASRAVVLNARERAERRVRLVRGQLNRGDVDVPAALETLDDVLNDLREIEVEIAPE